MRHAFTITLGLLTAASLADTPVPHASVADPNLIAHPVLNAPDPDTTPIRRVASAVELQKVLNSDFKGRVVIPKDADWVMEDPCGMKDEFGRCLSFQMMNLPVQSGVRIVGERGALGSRPLLRSKYPGTGVGYALFSANATDVVIQGLHLQGPEQGKRDKVSFPYDVAGIIVWSDPVIQTGRHILIDDNELDEWPGAAVSIKGTVDVWDPNEYSGPRYHPADMGQIYVSRNYLHHNARAEAGYGVVISSAFATIEGNVFDYNRHAISSSGKPFAGYTARFNYVLQGGHTYGGFYQQLFDVHGSGTEAQRAQHHYDGGGAGEQYEISSNTFRGEQESGGFLGIGQSTRPAFELRGRPAIGATFTDNVLVHDNQGEALELVSGSDHSLHTGNPSTFNLTIVRNRYDQDYATEIAAGDFDGDGRTDVFLANGTAWFFSRGGVGAWEFLRASTQRTRELAFADVDDDHITDVVYRDEGGNLRYLKGGRGQPIALAHCPVPIEELRFGDFDADGRTDMFYTLNHEWHIWSGATRAWLPAPAATSDKPISELLFGEFDDVPGTDVVGIDHEAWVYSSGARTAWQKLNNREVGSFANAVAIDVDGNGRTDILVEYDYIDWKVSRDGRGPLETAQVGANAYGLERHLKSLPTGTFDGERAQRLVTFLHGKDELYVWKGPSEDPQPAPFKQLSRVNLR